MTKKVSEQVAAEKYRMSRRSGDSHEKAQKYADEVRKYSAKQQKDGKR